MHRSSCVQATYQTCVPEFTGIRSVAIRRGRNRAGFSLMEVILSIAVLFASGIALAQLASLGRRHADRAESLTTAQVLCQNKLNEIAAGLTPLVSATDVPFVESPGWAYSVVVQPATWNGLVAVQVSVSELPIGAAGAVPRSGTTGLSTTVMTRPRFSLVRWLRTTDAVKDESDEPFENVDDTSVARFAP